MAKINRFRQHFVGLFAWSVVLALVFLTFTTIALAASPSQAGVSWDYRLLGKLNTAQDPVNGLTILITGGGSFDVIQNSIDGGGSYSILDSGGNVVGSGAWAASTFDGFIPAGPGSSPGEGGHLELEAAFQGTGTGALNGSQHIVIQCSMWGTQAGPPGYPWSPDFVEAGPYTIHKTGGVMFNLNQ